MSVHKRQVVVSPARRMTNSVLALLDRPSGWALLLGLWLSANAVIFFWPQDQTDKKYYETFAGIWSSAREFQASNSKEEWDEFTAKSLAQLAPIIDELEEDANPRYPAKQHLLWAGRDCLRPLLERGTFDEQKFLNHMATARRHLRTRGLEVAELAAK